MSKTLQLLGYEVGQQPVTDEMRLDYGFPTNPSDLHELAIEVMQGNSDPGRYKIGSDFALAVADVLRGDRSGDVLDDSGTIRPFALDEEDVAVWEGFGASFPRVVKARGMQRKLKLPDFNELGDPSLNGDILGAFVRDDGSAHTARVFSVESAAYERLREIRPIDYGTLQSSIAVVAINAYGSPEGEGRQLSSS